MNCTVGPGFASVLWTLPGLRNSLPGRGTSPQRLSPRPVGTKRYKSALFLLACCVLPMAAQPSTGPANLAVPPGRSDLSRLRPQYNRHQDCKQNHSLSVH